MTGVFFNEIVFDEIKIRFSKINNVNEFAALLNYIENIIYNPDKELHPITFKHLYFLSKTKDTRYNDFFISKKNGDLRLISTPDNLLKRVQNLINILLQIVFKSHAHYCSNGFLIGKDIKRNAIPHTNKRFVLNIDIKDFFPSVNFRRVKVVLGLSPFKLTDHREKIAFLIANLGTHKGYLPQGAPTSPILSNIVTQKLDRKIAKFCIESKVKYSRYADDLSFSSNKDIFNQYFIESITKIIEEENFSVNDKKTRVRSNRESQQVTGLIVNEKVNIKKEYLQKVRAMINNWEKGGLLYAEKVFKIHQPIERINYNFKSVLLGHLSFIKLIKGDDHIPTKKLRHKFSLLSNLINYDFIPHDKLREKLKVDNLKMENIFFQGNMETHEFISYCTSAFHQVENLINYYYWKKFPNYDDLLNELLTQNPNFGKRYKDLQMAKNSFPKLSKLNLNVLIFLYEKDFFFDKKISYNKHLTMLREIRNDDSHRCSIMGTDENKIKEDYLDLINSRKEKRHKKLPKVEQERIELNYNTLIFMEKKNFKEVRENLKKVAENIKTYFDHNN